MVYSLRLPLRFALALFLAAIALTALPLLTGCSTTAPGADGPLPPDRVQRIARMAVWTTTVGMVGAKPEREVQFRKAQVAIDVLVKNQVWDVGALAAALNSTGVDEFTGAEGRLILAGTALLIDTIAGREVDLSDQQYLRAVILGAQEGLALALGE
jgi:hypothetical protein